MTLSTTREGPVPSGPEASAGPPPVPPGDLAGRRRRRRRLSVATGAVIGALLAVVLVTSLKPSAPAASSVTGPSPAPGVSAEDADLLGLTVMGPTANFNAPNFHLVDQYGRPTSLAQFRGKVVIWSLNDDRCTDLCQLYAQDIVAADKDLGPAAKDVVFLAVNANPFYPSPSSLRAWSSTNDLDRLSNWVYVTGSEAQLKATWHSYRVTVELDNKARTVVHDTTADYIKPTGQVGAVGDFQEGSISTGFYAHSMAQMAADLLPAAQRVKVGGPDVASPAAAGATIDDAAPRFSLPVMGTGKSVAISSFGGKPLVLNFWASTCTVCTQEMPALEKVDKGFHGTVNFVGVDVADPRSAAAAFARRAGATYPLMADKDGTVAAQYRVAALPVTFVIGPDGTIEARHDGNLTHDELVAVLEVDFPNLPQS